MLSIETLPINTNPDAIVVPGGGLTDEGLPHPWVTNRLDRAAELYQNADNALALPRIIALSAGTVYKPPFLDADGFPVFESVASARYLVKNHDVNPDDILTERSSYDSLGTAVAMHRPRPKS
jgi:uncharacterized SAM-binding protein YcdF (DUF218 family)